MLELANGVKFILVTSVMNDNNPDDALGKLYENYLNNVKRNYLYRPGQLIKVVKFDEEVRKILKTLEEKDK